MTITNTVAKNLRLCGSVLADPKQIEKDRRIGDRKRQDFGNFSAKSLFDDPDNSKNASIKLVPCFLLKIHKEEHCCEFQQNRTSFCYIKRVKCAKSEFLGSYT